MKSLDYYAAAQLKRPVSDDFGDVYVYHRGTFVSKSPIAKWDDDKKRAYLRKKYGDGFTVVKNYDRQAYQAELSLYQAERDRFDAEFRDDLFAKHGVSGLPIAREAFIVAREHANLVLQRTVVIFVDIIGFAKA
jgi:hypothetical protein